MAFNGKLIEIYNSSTRGWDNFPLSFVYRESYQITPNRRIDLDSESNADGVLQRNVLAHTASTIEFTTKPMWNNEYASMMSFIRNRYTIPQEKRIRLRYYAPDIDSYKEGDFYIPDIEMSIYRVIVEPNNNKIFYNSSILKFIEY